MSYDVCVLIAIALRLDLAAVLLGAAKPRGWGVVVTMPARSRHGRVRGLRGGAAGKLLTMPEPGWVGGSAA